MARKRNTFEKQRRDMEKKLRADAKRKKRLEKKDKPAPSAFQLPAIEPEPTDVAD